MKGDGFNVKVFDFFSGCGGASCGFRAAGMDVVFTLDRDAFESAAGQDGALTYAMGSCLIVIYVKPGTTVEAGLQTRSVRESDLAERLIGDLTGMVEGLMPSIALTGLTAVRENAHKVLRRFETKLDPAFLTHRACLPSPADSEQHMVAQLASELHGIMDEAVAKESPATIDVIGWWLSKFKGDVVPRVAETTGAWQRWND